MKLLLTSIGLSNAAIRQAFFDLLEKPVHESTLVYIPTASNAETGDKNWVIDDLIIIKSLNFKSIEITDISAVGEEIWKPSFERADILYFEGGNTYHLMRWIQKTGLITLLPKMLETKVFVGVSAGSMITNPDLALKLSQKIYEESMLETEQMKGLGLVDFYFLPHLNSNWFLKMRRENIELLKNDINRKVYVMDDQSAVKVVDHEIEIISEGEWFVINQED
jgi:dipeptidase E